MSWLISSFFDAEMKGLDFLLDTLLKDEIDLLLLPFINISAPKSRRSSQVERWFPSMAK